MYLPIDLMNIILTYVAVSQFLDIYEENKNNFTINFFDNYEKYPIKSFIKFDILASD